MHGRPESDGRIRTELVDAEAIGIYLDEAGQFMARTPGGDSGDWTKADTLKALLEKVRKQKRSAALRLEIPMTLLDQGRGWSHDEKKQPSAQQVTLTGIHARTAKALLTYADGRKGTHDSYDDGALVRRLSNDEAKEWVDAVKAARAAEARVETLTNQYKRNASLPDFIKDYVKQHSTAAEGDLAGVEVADDHD